MNFARITSCYRCGRKKMMKAGGTDSWKTLAGKSRGLFGRGDLVGGEAGPLVEERDAGRVSGQHPGTTSPSYDTRLQRASWLLLPFGPVPTISQSMARNLVGIAAEEED
ncbi:hypothetical protein F7725_017849 [Dissostichus mawsoni]|uniref:Uncharacterized protein n=1 Tax=Dissostichus mawsoni TaxID=36200 RepID=A0A7J5XPZ0_DISMA|nr:hypothetical protein F7725_017849 [Dissostichus mawsoni]